MKTAVLLLLLAGSTAAYGKPLTKTPAQAAPDTKYEAALDAFQELDSAASVGLNFRQFNERVINVKIKVDKLGDDPRYKLMKETTRLLIDTSTVWNGHVAGTLPMSALRDLKERYANDADLQRGLSKMSDDSGTGYSKQLWEVNAKYVYQVLWLYAQRSISKVLGKSPKGQLGKNSSKSGAAYSGVFVRSPDDDPPLWSERG
jgi:hypothetical protein